MSKSISILLIFLAFTKSLVAQESFKTSSPKDSMAHDSRKFLIRWGDVTLGYSLSDKEEILHQDDRAIIIGSNGHPERLIATYAFTPAILTPGLQLEFINLKVVTLGGFGSEADQEKFHPIPEWLTTLCQLEALVLSNAELSNIAVCDKLPLKYIDLRKVHFIDRSSVLTIIENLHDLEIFVHDESFSKEDLSIVKEKLPNVKFASKGSGKTER
jgi:hypothetical protein